MFDRVWNSLVHVDVDGRKVSIHTRREGNQARTQFPSSPQLTTVDEPMDLKDAMIGLQAYKEVDRRAKQLWHTVNEAIIIPRMDATSATVPGIYVNNVRATIRHLNQRSSNTSIRLY